PRVSTNEKGSRRPGCLLARFRAEKNRHRPRGRNAPEKPRRLQALQAKSRRSGRRAAGFDGLRYRGVANRHGSVQLGRKTQSLGGFMEFANINDTMRTAKDEEKRFIPL